MFNDRARIRVTAGRGGDGGLSFRREKFVPKGGPDGGDGGRGGDVVLVVDPDLRDLSAFRSKTVFAAGRGGNGRGTRKHGADGEDVVLRVPSGTQVTNARTARSLPTCARATHAWSSRAAVRGQGELPFRDAHAAGAAVCRNRASWRSASSSISTSS